MYDVYTDIGQYQYCFLILNQSYLCLHILCIKITSIDRQLSNTIHAEPGNFHARSLLVDFLHMVTNDQCDPFDESSGGQFYLSSNTFHWTVSIIDRYCSKVTTVEINKFQLVGVTAILIASKHNNEPNLPDANDLLPTAVPLGRKS